MRPGIKTQTWTVSGHYTTELLIRPALLTKGCTETIQQLYCQYVHNTTDSIMTMSNMGSFFNMKHEEQVISKHTSKQAMQNIKYQKKQELSR